MIALPDDQWALILGGSSGFGLASARRLAAGGMKVCVVHRDRRGAMGPVNEAFDGIRALGGEFQSFNVDALGEAGVATVRDALREHLSDGSRIRLLLHSIANGNLKPLALPPGTAAPPGAARAVASDEDFAFTIHAMGTSLWTWVRTLHEAGLFAADARVVGLTSEGSRRAMVGYAAVAAAKSALESVSRAIAMECAPHGIRANVIQAGVTDTPAFRMIPGHEDLKAEALRRNPFHRLTRPEDVANVVALLATDEAAWINGAVIHVDGGEHLG